MILRKILLAAWLASLSACSPLVTSRQLDPPTANPSAPPAVLREDGSPGTFAPVACRFALPDGLVEGEDIECGVLFVPEQRRDAVADISAGAGSKDRIIRLFVAILHPPGGAIHLDPVIFLSGGPGASILEMMRYQYDDLVAPVFAVGRDLVVFDQRGVGLSHPALDCPEYDRMILELLDHQIDSQRVSPDEMNALVLDSLQLCRERLNQIADLSAYHSAASAADVEDLRQALGYKQINLWGGSYGSRLALEVIRRYPRNLRSVALEAVYPPDVDLNAQAPANFHRSLQRLFAACVENPICSQSYPDLEDIFFDTVARLNEDPVKREIENPMTGETYPAIMDGNVLLGITFHLLYDSKLRYLLPKQIYAASQGDYSDFDRMRGLMVATMPMSSRGMMFSVLCHDEFAFSSLDAFQEQAVRYPRLATMYEGSLLGALPYQVCPQWGAGQAEASANQAVLSSVPAMVISGEFDPITPPTWGQQAAHTLENSFVFEYPGIGHGASVADPCPRDMLSSFFDDPVSAPEDGCIAEMMAYAR